MSIMASIYHQGLKRCYIDDEDIDISSSSKKLKRLDKYHQQEFEQSAYQWSLQWQNKIKKNHKKKKEYHCQVYLKFYRATNKCTLDVIVKSSNDIINDNDSILLAKTRIPKIIQPGVIRVRLVSSLFTADIDVCEDPSLIKLETIKKDYNNKNFDKQFALKLKNNRIGPGVIGKLFIESLDPSNGSYRNESPIFELNLSLTSEHEIISTPLHQNFDNNLICGCCLSSDESRLKISDQCNLKLNNMKFLHRLAEPLRCQWKSIGRELSPCFSEIDLIEFQQTYFAFDGNHECAYQLLREWYIRDPHQANIRYLITRLKLPFDMIVKIHDDIIRTFTCN
ncbi:unnamed protein product [Adineta steineri]|uniref:Death domain-containing protein n=1 Tax=Adineta steineri TaxID=433720 RepID=A0A814IXN1_9BILA|nr:unnamed protein product [Adineta steineri]CAF1101535.1 unnamed protein product [Adineta steineri]